MGKRWKIVITIVGALFTIAVVGVWWFMHRFSAETSVMTPAPTGLVVDQVYAIKDEFVNMYLVGDSDRYIAIDAGKDLSVVQNELSKLGVDPEQVAAVLLTHTDMDHVAALPLFRRATIYLAREEEDMLTGKQQKVPFYNNSMPRNDYTLLNDGQVLTIGGLKVACILTPGHTSGSMCFQVNDKYLFTGDILSLKEGKVGPSVEFFDMDHAKATEAIRRVTELPHVQYLFSAHHGFSANYPAAVRDWNVAHPDAP